MQITNFNPLTTASIPAASGAQTTKDGATFTDTLAESLAYDPFGPFRSRPAGAQTALMPSPAAVDHSSFGPFLPRTYEAAVAESLSVAPEAVDELPMGGGRTTESGAPLIEDNPEPVRNQWNYGGPAARNPYFTHCSNPMREGYVAGFDNWFRDTLITGGLAPVNANRYYYATEEGAAEALRLAREYAPEAELVQESWGCAPFSATNTMYMVQLPNGHRENAGLILASFYNHGYGVTWDSDTRLQDALGVTSS